MVNWGLWTFPSSHLGCLLLTPTPQAQPCITRIEYADWNLGVIIYWTWLQVGYCSTLHKRCHSLINVTHKMSLTKYVTHKKVTPWWHMVKWNLLSLTVLSHYFTGHMMVTHNFGFYLSQIHYFKHNPQNFSHSHGIRGGKTTFSASICWKHAYPIPPYCNCLSWPPEHLFCIHPLQHSFIH